MTSLPTWNPPLRRGFGLSVPAWLCILIASGAFAQTAPVEELRQLMKTVSEEAIAGKADTLITHTLPSVVAVLGGEEKARETLSKMMRRMTTTLDIMGYKIKSYTAAEPEKARTAGETTFVLIPTTMVAEGDEGKMTEKSHVLAIWKGGSGAKWYILRLGMTEDHLRQVLPELPADFILPAKQPAVFEKP